MLRASLTACTRSPPPSPPPACRIVDCVQKGAKASATVAFVRNDTSDRRRQPGATGLLVVHIASVTWTPDQVKIVRRCPQVANATAQAVKPLMSPTEWEEWKKDDARNAAPGINVEQIAPQPTSPTLESLQSQAREMQQHYDTLVSSNAPHIKHGAWRGTIHEFHQQVASLEAASGVASNTTTARQAGTLAADPSGWSRAPPPNYSKNKYLDVACSSVAYRDCMNLDFGRRIPVAIPLLDYFGEGWTQFDSSGGHSGFADAVNVNHQYQVSLCASHLSMGFPSKWCFAGWRDYDELTCHGSHLLSCHSHMRAGCQQR
jgi:hypothetical protein